MYKSPQCCLYIVCCFYVRGLTNYKLTNYSEKVHPASDSFFLPSVVIITHTPLHLYGLTKYLSFERAASEQKR